MDNFKNKYLKYKNKYFKMKLQIGGTYLIHNFHKKRSTIAMAEAITRGTLKEQMTQHGLGTGVYGFINISDANPGNEVYRINKENIIKELIITKPLILQYKWVNDGETCSDLDMFTALSIRLNIICHTYVTTHSSYKDNIEIPTIIEFLESNMYLYFIKEEDKIVGCSLTSTIRVSLDYIKKVIINFIADYIILSDTPEEPQHYILMPINYLLHMLDYDGVYNIIDDSGTTGSVKYFFNSDIAARGYNVILKQSPSHLSGRLIFMKNIIKKME